MLPRTAALFFVAAVFVFSMPGFCRATTEDFPVFPEISTSVDFWKNIYSRYDLTQGVIHDKDDLGIIYEIVNLDHPDTYQARKKNNKKVERTRKDLRRILLKFADGAKPSSPEEQRVRNLFGKNPSRAGFKMAADNIRVQLGQKDRFRRGVIRSGAFLKQIKKIFRDEGIPSDLAYLAHVESSYNVNAYSKFGAAGIWQFTRSTGKMYMKIDYAIDERRDPIIASRAATRFLRENYQKLGSWPLAITAYNHGVGGMARAKNKHGSYQNVWRDYDGRTFGFASKNFYSEFLAAREVARDYRLHFGELPFDSPWPVREIKMSGYANPVKLAEHFGVDPALIRKYNPALRSPVFEGQKFIPKGYSLRLPSDSSHLVQLAANLPDDIFSASQMRSRFYQVRRGDSAGSIARMHGVSVRDLVMVNELTGRATIYAGQNLRVPGLGEEPIVLSKSYKSQVAAATTGQLPELTKTAMLMPATEAEPPVVLDQPMVAAMLEEVSEVPKPAAAANDQPLSDELVREGVEVERESSPHSQGLIFGVRDFLNTRSAGLTPSPLPVGDGYGSEQRPVDDAGLFLLDINPRVVTGQLQVTKVYSKQGRTFGVIKVESEETLGHYADWLGIPTWMLRKDNRLRYGKSIMVGQEISIPLNKGGRDAFEEKRYEYHKELVEDFFAAYRVDRVMKYKVKSGDNIWTLCRNEFDLPFWLVRQYNQSLSPGGLKPSQELLVPVVSRRQIDIAVMVGKNNADS